MSRSTLSQDGDELHGTDSRRRRVNVTWAAMALGWLVVILVAFFPFPWWW